MFFLFGNLVLFLGAIGVIYGYGVTHYRNCFLRGTCINGLDCSDMEPDEVCAILDSQIQDYVLEVTGRDPENPESVAVLGTISPEDISMHRKDSDQLVHEVFSRQNPYLWFEMFWNEGNSYEFEQEITFETEKLTSYLAGWEAYGDTSIVEPKDAYMSDYLPEENAYRVIPDTRGSKLDGVMTIPAIESALYAMEKQVDIEDTGCYADAKVRVNDQKLNELADQVNSMLATTINYNWYGTEFTVGREEMSKWVSLVDGQPTLDEDAVREFVNNAKKEYDPKGKTYVFHTSLGADVKLKVKSGWVSDAEKEGEELIRLIREGAVTERHPASSTEDYVFFDGTVGDSYAEVDLTNQHMYFYYQGELVLETDFVSGDVASGHATPEGIFAVTFKEKDRILRGPDYESFVHYWMPFYGGYGMHDAMWRRVFGGSIFLDNGSHGCVNLPLKNAEKIYGYVEKGFPVVCYYYPAGKNPKDNLVTVSGNAQAAGSTQGNNAEQAAGSTQGNGTGQTSENGQTDATGQNAEGSEQLVEENEIRGQW